MNKWLTGDIPSQGSSGAVLDEQTGLFVVDDGDLNTPEIMLYYRSGAAAESLEGLLPDSTSDILDTDIGRTSGTSETPGGRVWFSVNHEGGDAVFLEKHDGGSGVARWHNPPSMAEGAKRLNARGEAITETKIWRNGEYTDLNGITSKPETVTITEAIDLASNGIILVEATDDGGTRTGLLLPVEISWNEIAGYENLSDHTDPWTTPATIKGKRIFPGSKNPDEPAILDKLELLVKTSANQAGKTVYVKAFDVDDTTSEAFDSDEVIDSHDKAGNDNLDDYKQTPKNGQFWTGSAWGNNESNAVLDSNGEAKFTFGVGMQPGNNYRVVVSLDDATPLDAIQVSDPNAPSYLGSELFATAGGLPASPLLTVWRRLWVENDSMEAIGNHDFGYKANDLSWDLGENNVIQNFTVNGAGTATSFRIPQISDTSSFGNLRNGRFVIQSVVHPVTGTYFTVTNPSQGISPIYEVTVAGNHTNTPASSGFRLYDDDDKGLSAPPLPKNDLVNEQMKNYFRSSFVEITDAADFHTDKEVPFRQNEDVSTKLYGMSSTVVADARELTDSPALWVAPLTAAYQGPQDADKDPSGADEGLRQGETATYDDRDHSTVFVEGCREIFDSGLRSPNPQTVLNNLGYLEKWIIANAAHEIGHQPGVKTEEADHAEHGLMEAQLDGVSNITPENAKFAPSTVLRFRKSTRWSQ